MNLVKTNHPIEKPTTTLRIRNIHLRRKKTKKKSENIISVITAEGAIVEGEISQGFAGSAGIARQIRKAHEDDKTKAIVFRVNSPGGSIIASEIIRDELLQAKNKGKKVGKRANRSFRTC